MNIFSKKNNDWKLRIHVQKGLNLAVADSNGTSDPYAVLLVDGSKKNSTEVIPKTLNPEWNEHFTIPLSKEKPISFIEIEVWDKDKLTELSFKELLTFKKELYQDDFLGKITLPVGKLFEKINASGEAIEFSSLDNSDVVLPLEKQSEHDNVQGEIQIKFGLIKGLDNTLSCEQFWNEYIR
ncbi:C2-domain-containing protein [Backusella circina FSU 941]|nr:C2-domain-containing protein [Backusella circina FSU 941]